MFDGRPSDRGEYLDFELKWEWKVAKASNSGIKCRVFGMDLISFGFPRFAAGWEYQMADDIVDAGARVDDRQKSGALYGVVAVSKPTARPAGVWNESRLILAADHVEHWLNVLQHHSLEVSFRKIGIRRIQR